MALRNSNNPFSKFGIWDRTAEKQISLLDKKSVLLRPTGTKSRYSVQACNTWAEHDFPLMQHNGIHSYSVFPLDGYS